MAHRLVWCWWRLIRCRTFFSGANGALSDGTPFLVLVALHQMAQSLVWWWWCYYIELLIGMIFTWCEMSSCNICM
jgi:hypothetical protein